MILNHFERPLLALATSLAAALLTLALTAAPVSANPADGNSAIAVRRSGGGTVVVAPFTTDRKSGLSDAQCEVAIAGQTLTVIGEGETEAYTCIGLVDAGPLPPRAAQERIGLIYDVASPNASFRTAAILVETSGTWTIDAASLGKYDDTAAAQSVKALASALADELPGESD